MEPIFKYFSSKLFPEVRFVPELTVEIPEILESERTRLKEEVEELISYETKRKTFLELTDELMKGAKQLSAEEIVKLSRKLKKGRFEQLKEEGLV